MPAFRGHLTPLGGGGGGVAVGSSGVAASQLPPDTMIALHPTLFAAAAVISGANRTVTARTVAPKTGFIRDMVIACAVSSGNIDVGVYDTGDTTTTVRTLKGHSGSIACPTAASGKLVVTWDPGAGAIACTAGQQFEFALACDNVTATFYRVAPGLAWYPDAFWAVPGAALPKAAAVVVTAFPMLNTVAEASFLAQNYLPFIMARVSAT